MAASNEKAKETREEFVDSVYQAKADVVAEVMDNTAQAAADSLTERAE